MKQEHKILKNDNVQLAKEPDDTEVIGPGRLLKDARVVLGLSQQQVADKLNFRTSLVQDIEIDKLDLTLPEAFNRGYLKNYARLVDISPESVLDSYDKLGLIQRQCSGMQSFSKGTEKQAEHNMVMWITYLILGVLLTATVVWWLQRPSVQPEPIITEAVDVLVSNNAPDSVIDAMNPETLNGVATTGQLESKAMVALSENSIEDNLLVANNDKLDVNKMLLSDVDQLDAKQEIVSPELTTLANVAFTFSGDCWVNIYDATGERLAWGVKKSGYIMRISGQPPFSITLGKPELVQIDYNDISVDMTDFNAGNIAKFSLPLMP